MDITNLGKNIADLRKKRGLTQSQLAAALNVSNKTVSKWERNQGYPEITQLPAIAEFFDISLDNLLSDERKGIALAGNILTDIVKTVDCYPKRGMLSNIKTISRCVGGCVPNTAIDLAKIDRTIPLFALGCVGDDENGRYSISTLQRYNINVDNVITSKSSPTSFSDVISEVSGERTFFHARGANAEFNPSQIDIDSLSCRILHIGYILLLDSFDKEDSEYGTVMARFLHDVKQRGIETSIDAVSDSSGNYKSKIVPALKYCDYVIINEVEACMVSGLEPYNEDGSLNLENIEKTMRQLADCGVSKKVIVHCKSAGFCYNVATNTFTRVNSINIPKSEIKGSVGAGDAFCAGSLYGIYNAFSDKEILEFASVSAAANLFAENSIDGLRSRKELLKIYEKYGRIQ